MGRTGRWRICRALTSMLICSGAGLVVAQPATAGSAAGQIGGVLRTVPLETRGHNGFTVDVNRAGLVLGAFFNDQAEQIPVIWPNYQTPVPLGVGRMPAAINNRGHVVGSRVGPNGAYGWLWRNGHLAYLRSSVQVFAVDVNDHDQVVGFLRSEGPFFWENGRLTRIRAPRGMAASVLAINNRGEVLGTLVNEDFSLVQGFVWRRGAMTVLRSPYGGWLTPTDINDRGQVVGTVELPGTGEPRPFLWRSGRVVDLLASRTSWRGRAAAINDAGDIVGTAYRGDQPSRAALWRHGRMIDLGTPRNGATSDARMVNERGDVAGVIATPVSAGMRLEVFRWRNGWLLLSAPIIATDDNDDISLEGMDERGRIVGSGRAWVASHRG